jgi:hypothetical protein
MANQKRIASTQEHLDIEDIRDNLVILKNGNAVVVLQTTAVNFDLLSESEQDAMIFAFAALVNSLTFPIQVLVRSKRVDITNYLIRLEAAKKTAYSSGLVSQIEKYENFIRDLVSKNQVLDKRFYVVTPYIGIDLSQIKNFSGIFSPKRPRVSKWAVLEKAKVNLEPKVEHLIKQLARIGIKAVQLTTEELVELFYDLYNPEVAREQKAALGTREYTTPVVEPAIAPAPEQNIEEAKLTSEEGGVEEKDR